MTNNSKTVSSLPFGMTELTTVSTRIVDALTRDLEDLSPLGITTTKIAEFTNQINTLMAMKKDQDHKASMRLMAKTKSQKLQELVDSLRIMEFTIKTNFGLDYDCEALIIMRSVRSLSGKQVLATLGHVFSELKSSDVLYKNNDSIKTAIDNAESAFVKYSEEYAKSTDLMHTRRKSVDVRLLEAYKLYAQLLYYSNIGRGFWNVKSSNRALDYKLPFRKYNAKKVIVPETASNSLVA